MAWNSGRAVPKRPIRTKGAVGAVKLVRDGVICATLDACVSVSTEGGRVVSPMRSECGGISDSRYVCVREEESEGRVLIGYANGQGEFVVYAVANDMERHAEMRQTVSKGRYGSHVDVSCMDVIAKDGATIVAGTSRGTIVIHRRRGVMWEYRVSRHAITAVTVDGEDAVVGTSGGEVVRMDVGCGRVVQTYIGPCSCTVTAVCAGGGGIVAGFGHVVGGNGHRCAAVGWDGGSGMRLGAFGRGWARSSAAFPVAGVRDVAMGGRRVGVLAEAGVRMYDMRKWECVVEGAIGGTAMDVDGGRVAVGGERGGVDVLDFGEAVRKWPSDVPRFVPGGSQ